MCPLNILLCAGEELCSVEQHTECGMNIDMEAGERQEQLQQFLFDAFGQGTIRQQILISESQTRTQKHTCTQTLIHTNTHAHLRPAIIASDCER